MQCLRHRNHRACQMQPIPFLSIRRRIRQGCSIPISYRRRQSPCRHLWNSQPRTGARRRKNPFSGKLIFRSRRRARVSRILGRKITSLASRSDFHCRCDPDPELRPIHRRPPEPSSGRRTRAEQVRGAFPASSRPSAPSRHLRAKIHFSSRRWRTEERSECLGGKPSPASS